ncbi:MAG TPA: TIR domain-containing protein [Caulobacteraceae bacterium]|nr:TIR domain-containing protein [Caulobacteraceae bacterium]
MANVFVSYKAEDRERVKPLVDALLAEGLDVWWDLGIEGGANWRQTIQSHLDTAACVVVAWSDASVGASGYFVQDEAALARRRGVYLPVAIDAVQPPLGFGQEHILKLTQWRGDRRDPRFLDLLAAARAMVAAEPRPTPTAREKALRGGARGRWLAVAAAALLLAVGGLVIWRGPAALSPTGARAPANSIAVLPLTNLSGDPAQEYFADGLSEELIAALARLNELQVIGRTSSFRFKGSKEGAIVIGTKLGVAYLLDGAVRRDGQRVRVSAQLADTKTGFERWSEIYDRDMKDIFAVQSGIAEAVAQALKVRLIGGDITALSHGGTSDPGAYDAYLRARGLLQNASGEADDRAALAGYEAAIAADPRFAKAHAGRAVALLTLAGNFLAGGRLRDANRAALVSARRAVALAPDLAVIQVVLADALLNANLDVAGARRAFAQARKFGAGEPNVLIADGLFQCQIGQCAGGVADLRRAARLDPLNPLAYSKLGRGLIGQRDFPGAVSALRRALELNPGAQEVHAWLGDCRLMQGKLAEARGEYGREPLSWARLAGQAIILARLGDPAGARAALAALAIDPSNAYQRAQVRAQWGDIDGAFAALDDAIGVDDAGVLDLNMDPLMDPLRRDPRFGERVARLGLFTQPGP